MTISMFLILLSAFSLIVGLVVQALKKLLDESGRSYSSNVVACIVAAAVGIGGTAVYYDMAEIAFSTTNVICMVLMGLATAVGAMVGYDKVIQTIKQLTGKGGS
jgi:putative ammonium transporter